MQAEPLGLEQFTDHNVTDGMAPGIEFIGQHPQAFATPTQRRFGVPSRAWIDQREQACHQRRIFVRQRLTTTAAAPHRLCSGWRRSREEPVGLTFKFLHARHDRSANQTHCGCDLRHPTAANDPGFQCRLRAPLSPVQALAHQLPALMNR